MKADKGEERVHKVSLNPFIIDILNELKAAFGYLKSLYILPSTSCTTLEPDSQPIDKRSVARAVKRHLKALGVEPFVPHNLRRTLVTRLGDSGIDTDPIVVEKILNHRLQGTMGV